MVKRPAASRILTRNMENWFREFRRDTDRKIQDLNSCDRPPSQGQTPSRGCSPPRNMSAVTEDIYGNPRPSAQQQGPRPFPPQDARVNTHQERFYVKYPPLPPQPSQHPSRQQSQKPSQQPYQQPLQPPFQPYKQERTLHPYPYPQEPRQTIRERLQDIPPYEEEDGKDASLRLGIKPFQLYQQQERTPQPEPLRQREDAAAK